MPSCCAALRNSGRLGFSNIERSSAVLLGKLILIGGLDMHIPQHCSHEVMAYAGRL
jgi:hypothetical protein